MTAAPAVPPPGRFRALVCDVGGVLTTPLLAGFAAFQDHAGVPLEAVGRAVAAVTEEDGANPVHELELGRMTETDFLDRIGRALSADVGRPVAMHEFAERYWAALGPNEAMLDLAARVRGRGLPHRAADEQRARVGAALARDLRRRRALRARRRLGLRRPAQARPRDLPPHCERLGLPAEQCLFVDDLEPNVEAARAVGLGAVHYRDPEQAVAEVLAALAGA